MFYGQCNDCGQRWELGTARTCICEAAPVQEPVAIYRAGQAKGEHFHVQFFRRIDEDEALLWATPPAAQRQWIGLTKTVVGNHLRRHALGDQSTFRQGFKEGVAFAELKLKEKNT